MHSNAHNYWYLKMLAWTEVNKKKHLIKDGALLRICSAHLEILEFPIGDAH